MKTTQTITTTAVMFGQIAGNNTTEMAMVMIITLTRGLSVEVLEKDQQDLFQNH
jgi:hypothetical protein